MKIALIQLNTAWESRKANYQMAERYIRSAVDKGCDLVVFPEMFTTGFSMNLDAAEERNGETAEHLSSWSAEYRVNIISGYCIREKNSQKGKNIAVALNRKGELIAEYVKIHPFSFVKEDQYFEAGSTPVTFFIEDMPCSIFICYDLRFPEVFRSVAKHVQAIFVLANWPSSRVEHWKTLLRARAIENQCYLIGVNRTGTDGNGISYPGASAILDPLGDAVCFGNDRDAILTGEISPREVRRVRSAYPFLRDMLSTDRLLF